MLYLWYGTQIDNALKNGGMIVLNTQNLNSGFETLISLYGAADASGSYYTYGAVLNYIASWGWELVQAPTSGLSDYYYFVKWKVLIENDDF